MKEQVSSIDLTSEQLHLVRELLREHIPHAEVWAYGSRVKWTATPKSDLDLVAHVGKEAKRQICALREAFEESSLPFRVDLFIWDEVPEEFHEQIERGYFVMQRQLKESKLQKNFLPLGDCLSYTAKGITPKYLNTNSDNAILVLNQKCNRNSNIDFSLARFHDAQQKKVPVEKILNIGDVLINSTGTGTAGRVAQILRLQEATTVDSHMIILRCNEHLNTSYFGYAVKYNQREIEHLAEGSTGQTEINRKRLNTEIKLFCPPLQSQERIAHVLSTIDKKIELNQRINDNLEQQMNAIYVRSRSKANTTAQLSDLCVITSSKRVFAKDYSSSGVPFYRGKEITLKSKGEIFNNSLYISKDHFEKLRQRSGVPEFGNILLTAVGTLGNVYMVENEKFYFKDGNIIWLKEFTSEYTNYYVYAYMSSKEFKKAITTISIGTTQKAITIKSLSKLRIPLPSNKELNMFYRVNRSLLDKIAKNKSEILILTSLRDTLLPKLMSGEIDVSQVKL